MIQQVIFIYLIQTIYSVSIPSLADNCVGCLQAGYYYCDGIVSSSSCDTSSQLTCLKQLYGFNQAGNCQQYFNDINDIVKNGNSQTCTQSGQFLGSVTQSTNSQLTCRGMTFYNATSYQLTMDLAPDTKVWKKILRTPYKKTGNPTIICAGPIYSASVFSSIPQATSIYQEGSSRTFCFNYTYTPELQFVNVFLNGKNNLGKWTFSIYQVEDWTIDPVINTNPIISEIPSVTKVPISQNAISLQLSLFILALMTIII